MPGALLAGAERGSENAVMRIRRGTVVTACLLALALSGCAAGTNHVQLGRAEASRVQDLPVPVQAEQVVAVGKRLASYLLPLGITIGAIDQWYQERLAPGRAWRGWTSCSSRVRGGGSGGIDLVWARGAARLSLSTSARSDQSWIYLSQSGARPGCT